MPNQPAVRPAVMPDAAVPPAWRPLSLVAAVVLAALMAKLGEAGR